VSLGGGEAVEPIAMGASVESAGDFFSRGDGGVLSRIQVGGAGPVESTASGSDGRVKATVSDVPTRPGP
jgi:hypothetical protein